MKRDWKIRKLGEICDFQGGSQPPKSQFIYEPKKGYVRFLQIRDFASDKNVTYIPESKKNRYCNEDDILLGRYGASVGKVLVNKSGAYNVAVMKTLPDEKVLHKRYLFYYLNTEDFQSRLLKTASRSAQDGFSKDDIYEFPVLIPPLPEQKRIVAILDEAFAAIEKAKANAEKNLRNAKELFESYLNGVFENPGEDWCTLEIGEIAEIEYGYTDRAVDSGKFRYVRITDIDKNGKLISDDKKYIKYSKEAVGFVLKNNDLLMARTGATFGKVLLFESDEPAVFASYLIRIKFNSRIENSFYWFFSKSNNYWTQARLLQGGAAQPQFNGSALKKVVFSFPKSINQQREWVDKFEALYKETQKLESVYYLKIKDLENLKKSILQKAFSGELTSAKSLAV